MRCHDCGTIITDPLEAYARQACPNCDAPLLEPTAR
jgi:DNA-directed RNA polymerase subunit RPC12/RpoP